jgi:uncharacterized protein YbdZ (MbtH family)
VNSGPVNVKVLQPKEFPERKQPYVVRWRLNGRRYWRSFATKRGNNGADTFYSILTVATINERDWNSETGLPTSWDSKCEMNVAQYCRLYVQEEWRRLSPSTRKIYVEALTSFTVNCTRKGAPAPPTEIRDVVAKWLTPSFIEANASHPSDWVWSEESPAKIVHKWIARYSPSLGELDREVLYETDRRMRLRLDGSTLYAPTTQSRLVTVAKTALSTAIKRGLIDAVPWPRRESELSWTTCIVMQHLAGGCVNDGNESSLD